MLNFYIGIIWLEKIIISLEINNIKISNLRTEIKKFKNLMH